MKALSNQEFVTITHMSPEERFEFALQRIVENQQLWGLFGDNGWLLLQAEEDACLPIWPDEHFAQAWEKDDFPDCKPKVISLDEWMNQWLPGMANNGTLLLMFPLSDDEEGIMLEADEMKECFVEAIDSAKANDE